MSYYDGGWAPYVSAAERRHNAEREMEKLRKRGTVVSPVSCSCPDGASICKHVAAVMYGVGARLDARPEMLFRLRAVNENDLVANIGNVLPMSKQGPAAGKVLETGDVAALFGLDMGEPENSAKPAMHPVGGKPPPSREKPAPSLTATDPIVVPAKTSAPSPTAALRKREPEQEVAGAKSGAAKVERRKAVRVAAPVGNPNPQPVEWWKPGASKAATRRGCSAQNSRVKHAGQAEAAS